MVWLVLSYAIMGTVLAAFIGTGAYVTAVIVVLMMLVPPGLRAYRAWAMKPSGLICPNCGVGQVRIISRVEGMTGNSSSQFKRSFLTPRHRIRIDKQGESRVNRQRVGLCQSCGFDFPYITVDEVRRERSAATLAAIMAVIVTVLCVVFGLAEVSSGSNATQNDAANASTSIWNAQYAELTDFDYYIDGHSIVLKSYKGRAAKVRIAPSYNVDGEVMPVVELDGTFALKSIDSVIVPNSVTRIVSNTFNSCGVKNLYLPASLVDFTGWYYFHDVQKLYYGGTEEQWAALFTGERSQLDVVRIVCDTDPNALLTE